VVERVLLCAAGFGRFVIVFWPSPQARNIPIPA
jgi:hypothetical protein